MMKLSKRGGMFMLMFVYAIAATVIAVVVGIILAVCTKKTDGVVYTAKEK
jgi:NADH:ubiquinone oxidoreductase subunit K